MKSEVFVTANDGLLAVHLNVTNLGICDASCIACVIVPCKNCCKMCKNCYNMCNNIAKLESYIDFWLVVIGCMSLCNTVLYYRLTGGSKNPLELMQADTNLPVSNSVHR
jgi:hypothetical protein